jgi:rare lipoprotein A (peptidoglycan hydrolase)
MILLCSPERDAGARAGDEAPFRPVAAAAETKSGIKHAPARQKSVRAGKGSGGSEKKAQKEKAGTRKGRAGFSGRKSHRTLKHARKNSAGGRVLKGGNKPKERESVSASAEFPQNGIASFVGSRFYGKPTANGERHDPRSFTAAHRFAPFNSILKVTIPDSGHSILVRVNDRGPFVKKRVIDLSLSAAEHLGYVRKGLTPVRVELAGRDGEPNLFYYILMKPANGKPPVLPVRGFGPFARFDDAAAFFAALREKYPQAELVLRKEARAFSL